MGRPKGSKNRKKLAAGANLDELIAQKKEAKAALETERDEAAAVLAEYAADLRAVKAKLKRMEKELAEYEAQKSAAAVKEAVEAKIEALMAEGRSLEEIVGLLK